MNACMDFQNSSAYHYLELNTKKNAILNIKFGSEIPELLQKTKMGQNQGH